MSVSRSAHWQHIVLAALLLGATLVAYRPAWHGSPVWDDDGHLTRPELQSSEGLRRIWGELGATQQYYPVTHSAFWVMHRLWGDDTLGYHVVNVLLHVTSAILIALILRRLTVPGAMFAAALFALHPVHVESVAWMTELKNTLAGVFYFSAALVYLRFDRTRRWPMYAAALALFVLALLSKTVTASLPAALLVVFWWQRGRLDLRRDVLPLVPWLVLGVAAGRLTAHVERTFIGAQGVEFDLSPLSRVLLAGRVVWFYLGKLVWPGNLTFIYPKWTIDPSSATAYGYPAAVVAVLAAAWWWRGRSRAPLATALLFVGTLTPALGFVDVFPFRYSYVADHFPYLASVPVIAAVAGALTLTLARVSATAVAAAATIVLGVLGTLTWRQAHQYADVETLYRETLRRNPSCWLCLNNLGAMRLNGPSPNVQEAIRYVDEALTLYANNAEAHNNLGVAYSRLGRFDAARREHEVAVRLSPGDPDAHNNLGTDLERLGDRDGALREYLEAVRLRPRFAEARYKAGGLLTKAREFEAARAHLVVALEVNPQYADAYDALGTVELQLGRYEAAIEAYRQALLLRPDFGQGFNNLGMALERSGRQAEARTAYERAVALIPGEALAHDNLGYLLFRQGDRDRAVAELTEAIRLDPALASPRTNLGNVFMDRGDFRNAVVEYRTALTLAGGDTAQTHNNLGVALAQLGRISDAAVEFAAALRLDPSFEDARRNLARAQGR